MFSVAMPIDTPYLMTDSPAAIGFNAILCPAFVSLVAVKDNPLDRQRLASSDRPQGKGNVVGLGDTESPMGELCSPHRLCLR